VRRYTAGVLSHELIGMVDAADGDYVSHDDALAAIAAERARCLAWTAWSYGLRDPETLRIVTQKIESGAPALREG
jgi:hypothetical protein